MRFCARWPPDGSELIRIESRRSDRYSGSFLPTITAPGRLVLTGLGRVLATMAICCSRTSSCAVAAFDSVHKASKPGTIHFRFRIECSLRSAFSGRLTVNELIRLWGQCMDGVLPGAVALITNLLSKDDPPRRMISQDSIHG